MVTLVSIPGTCTLFPQFPIFPITDQQSKMNHSGADAQVISWHCYPVEFYSFVEQLTSIYLHIVHHYGTMSSMRQKGT